jgi:hypothetical protein
VHGGLRGRQYRFRRRKERTYVSILISPVGINDDPTRCGEPDSRLEEQGIPHAVLRGRGGSIATSKEGGLGAYESWEHVGVRGEEVRRLGAKVLYPLPEQVAP